MRARKKPPRYPRPLSEWPDIMIPEQLAECLGVDVHVVYYEIKHKGAPHTLIGKKRYQIFRDKWLAWMRNGKKKSFGGDSSADLTRSDVVYRGLERSDAI